MAKKAKKEDMKVSLGSASRELTPELAAEFKAIAAADPDNLVKPEKLIERAESPLSPLHRYFEWDDSKAAEAWRVSQARYLIRSFTIEIEPLKIVPAFVSLSDDRKRPGGGYKWFAEVLPQDQLKRNFLLTVLSDIENLTRRVEDEPVIKPVREAVIQARQHIVEN
jgi:hypothetical protein